MKRRLLVLAAVATPLFAGFIFSLLFESGTLENRLLVGDYLISFSGLASGLGILFALLAATAVGVRWWMQRQIANAETEIEAQQADARRRFLQRLDHELKNPLTIIRLGIVNLQQSSQQAGERVTSLERIGQQVQRLGRLIVDLRWLAELDARSIEHRPVNVPQLLTEVVAIAEEIPEYARRPVDVNIQQVPWPVAAVWGDRDLLLVVFRNLLDNALKYTSNGDRVEVRAHDDGQAATVEIADTGPGIPEEEIPHIFEELFRGTNAGTVPGSGLGLALVQRIVTLHDGTIQVRSRLGHGTVMTVRLPVAPTSS